MNITKIELVNFRNYKCLKLDKFTNLNVIIGSNGIGKTSILEAIYFGSLTKTFKYNNEEMLIKKDSSSLKVRIKLYDELKSFYVEVTFSENGKKTKINSTVIKKLSEFISQYKVIVFSPDELELIKGSPSTRRNYLNIQISQLNKEYITYLNSYNNLIKNKNDYLKKLMLNSNLDINYLEVVDEKLSVLGKKICDYRKEYIDKINKYIKKIYSKISTKSDIRLEYVSDFLNLEEKDILKIIRGHRNKEINQGTTSIGIHRDDIEFLNNNENSKYFSSQGIQKLIVLSVKLSEVEIFINDYDIKPIILLDDLFSELDIMNQNKVFNLLNLKSQIFITTTDLKNINKKIINKAKIFNIEKMVK